MDFIVGIDLGHPTIAAADRWIHGVVAPLARSARLIACTHVIARPCQHVAISVVGTGPPEVFRHLALPADDGASVSQAVFDHLRRRAGRAVVYPGVDRMTGRLRVDEITAISAIERVALFDGAAPGACAPPAEAKLDTRDHVRPCWANGELTLLVRPAAVGHLVPFEAPPPRQSF